ncbi:MAG: response regulator [Caulobacteraceae bacterium]|nr:response regulator [Caulobacteraceae bacterium]
MVEDDERVADLSGQLLTSLGSIVTTASSPKAALETLTLRRDDFDLLLTDVVMPGPIDGLELANTVKSRWPNLPVVLTTGATDVRLKTERDFTVLRKPFSAEVLWRVLRHASGS